MWALLQIVAYIDDRHGRTKHREELSRLMEQYELESVGILRLASFVPVRLRRLATTVASEAASPL